LLKKKVFSSWDQFILPFPFSKGCFVWGKPLWIEEKGDDLSREQQRQELETRLCAMLAEANEVVSRK
jgi:lysophospholipid acyltransferase (LPLAT)-like uncharacterized protein